MGVPFALSTAYVDGGEGARQVAELVVRTASTGQKSKPVYSLEATTSEKLDRLTRVVYGGEGVDYEPRATEDMALIKRLGLESNPICVAKTPLSLSDDASKQGRPTGFRVKVQKFRPAAGAGFNVAYMGDVVTMPGLSKQPLAEEMDLSDDGTITGVK